MNNKQICTWKDCNDEAKHIQLDKNNIEWSNLCDKHNKELEEAINNPIPKAILRTWVLASGGAKKLSKDMFR